jgi:ATP-dependent DNA ligase
MNRKPSKSVIPLMEAKSVGALPEGKEWAYEPKWDGFRCLALKDGGDVVLQGKSGKPLGRYFPEVVEAISGIGVKRLVLDGEIIIRGIDGELSFEALQMRLHPAASRIAKLSKETPASFTAFDVLIDGDGNPISAKPFKDRRKALEKLFDKIKEKDTLLSAAMSSSQPAMTAVPTTAQICAPVRANRFRKVR